jgi:hypothetical protein
MMHRFVDRDMFMRFLGGGVGHSVMKEKQMEPEAQHIQVDGDADAPDQVFDVPDSDEEASEEELEEGRRRTTSKTSMSSGLKMVEMAKSPKTSAMANCRFSCSLPPCRSARQYGCAQTRR